MGGFLGLAIVYTYAASGEVTHLPIDIAWSFTNLWSGMGILVGPFFSGKLLHLIWYAHPSDTNTKPHDLFMMLGWSPGRLISAVITSDQGQGRYGLVFPDPHQSQQRVSFYAYVIMVCRL